MNPTYLNPLYFFLSGLACMGSLVSALFFLRYWSKSGDRLFGFFAASFGFLALERIILMFWNTDRPEAQAPVYVIRLLAFLVILGGIWDKNRARKAKPAFES